MGLKTFTVTRSRRHLMEMLKWDRVHRVGIKVPVFFVVLAHWLTKFRPAIRFPHFIVLFAVMVEAGLNFVPTCLCCAVASLQRCPIAVAHLPAMLHSVCA